MHNEYFFWNDQYGKIYHHLEGSSPYKKLVNDLLDFLPSQKGLIYLDAGAGSGYVAELIIKRFEPLDLTAVDISEAQLTYLESRLAALPSSSAGHIHIARVDLTRKLPFASQSFDVIVANLVLTYINEFEGLKGAEALRGVLQELYRALRNGGVLCWSTPRKGVNFWNVFLASITDMLDLRHPSRLFYGPLILKHALQIQQKGKNGLYNFFEKNEIVNLLEDTGFAKIKTKITFASEALIFYCEKIE